MGLTFIILNLSKCVYFSCTRGLYLENAQINVLMLTRSIYKINDKNCHYFLSLFSIFLSEWYMGIKNMKTFVLKGLLVITDEAKLLTQVKQDAEFSKRNQLTA